MFFMFKKSGAERRKMQEVRAARYVQANAQPAREANENALELCWLSLKYPAVYFPQYFDKND